MRTYIILLLSSFLGASTYAQDNVYNYLEIYSPIAVSEMNRTGIPASIKLAQGLLESDWGRSELSVYANNHFGIKCGSDWTSRTYYKLDDDVNEHGKPVESCFRVFDSNEASYVAHSEFLLSNNRYAFLFDYGPTDFEAWAKGLSKAGYATDPTYPQKIIDIINKYDLHSFDLDHSMAKAEDIKKQVEETQPTSIENQNQDIEEVQDIEDVQDVVGVDTEQQNSHEKSRDYTKNSNPFIKTKKSQRKKSKKTDMNFLEEKFNNVVDLINDESDKIFDKKEHTQEIQNPQEEQENFENYHNEVLVYIATGSETITELAHKYDIEVDALVAYNDHAYRKDQQLVFGSRVYLAEKKNSYLGSRKEHQVSQGEKIIDISQQYGVKVRSLRQRNYLAANEEVRTGELIYISGVRLDSKPKTYIPKPSKNKIDGDYLEAKGIK